MQITFVCRFIVNDWSSIFHLISQCRTPTRLLINSRRHIFSGGIATATANFYRAIILQISQDFISNQTTSFSQLNSACGTSHDFPSTSIANYMPVDTLISKRRWCWYLKRRRKNDKFLFYAARRILEGSNWTSV